MIIGLALMLVGLLLYGLAFAICCGLCRDAASGDQQTIIHDNEGSYPCPRS